MAAQGSTKAKGVYAKLNAAISDVDRIGKDGTNSFHKYTYTSAEQVYRVIRGPLLEHGLVVIPEATGYEANGDLGTVRLRLRIVDTETGEAIESQWYGEGQDKGDKAVYKAVTGGMKTWLKHLFLLPADDDPEADASTDRAPARSKKTSNRSAPGGDDHGESDGLVVAKLTRLRGMVSKAGLTKQEMEAVGKWVKPNGKARQDRLTQAMQLLEAGKAKDLVELVS
jgi:hypothetical protein